MLYPGSVVPLAMFFLLFSSFTFFTFWSLSGVWFFGSAGCWTWEGHVHLHFSCIGFWSVYSVVLFLVLISTLWNILARYGSVWECHLDPHFSWIDFSSEKYQMNVHTRLCCRLWLFSVKSAKWGVDLTFRICMTPVRVVRRIVWHGRSLFLSESSNGPSVFIVWKFNIAL